jgi:hypothetical protein
MLAPDSCLQTHQPAVHFFIICLKSERVGIERIKGLLRHRFAIKIFVT